MKIEKIIKGSFAVIGKEGSTECIYCLLFTMFFDEGANKAYLIDPEFVKGND